MGRHRSRSRIRDERIPFDKPAEVTEVKITYVSDSLQQSNKSNVSWNNTFSSVFCPRSFQRGRLARGYARFQAFDTLQALCSYLRGVLCTQALLKGLGVGSSEATAGAAALTFITKDGAGMLGSLGLAWVFSDSFGTRIKAWRLFADITNDIALAIDLYAPKFAPSNLFVVLICISSVLKAWCGVAAGATRAAITAHFAINNEDIADIAAKEGSQETAVTLIGMLLGYLFLTYASDPADVQTNLIWGLFWFLTLVHVFANYQAVRSLHFRTLDWWRIDIILKDPENTTFESVSKEEPLIATAPSAKFPSVNVFSKQSKYFTSSTCDSVSFSEDGILVGKEASAQDFIVACFALRWCQLNRRRGKSKDLGKEAAIVSLSFVELVTRLGEQGWQLEASRALLGDISENRIHL